MDEISAKAQGVFTIGENAYAIGLPGLKSIHDFTRTHPGSAGAGRASLAATLWPRAIALADGVGRDSGASG